MIMPRNRTFRREEPDVTSKLFIVICEGKRREGDYFNYFSELDSRVAVEVVRPGNGDDNSPTGLFHKAILLLEGNEEIESKYDIKEEDEVWFIIDTDQWGVKIDELRGMAEDRLQMYVAQSNPCFEVWLYYHFSATKPEFKDKHVPASWKRYLNEIIPGGFDSTKHPILISDAISNAELNFSVFDENIEPCTTEVYLLAKKIYEIIEAKIDSARNKMDI